MQRSILKLFLPVALPFVLFAVCLPKTSIAQSKSLPSTPRSTPSSIPDLSGAWMPDNTRGGIGQSISLVDPSGKLRGKEPDIPYQSWSLQQTMSEFPATGPDGRYERTTDPSILFCEPLGVGRIYMMPARTRFVQTVDVVYILHELGQQFRVVRLNNHHPDDPDPSWWGDSIGWYENGNTLVIDSVGFNDKTWLDQLGHPHTDKLHFIERYRLVDKNTLDLEMTIDDPGAYTRPFFSRRNLTRPKVPFMRDSEVCSTRANQDHIDKFAKPAASIPSR